MKSREEVEIVEQVVFGDDGELERTSEPVETTMMDWGVPVDTQERETRYESPRATRFGVDDRAVVKETSSEQESLFSDVDEDQVTLTGEEAEPVFKWRKDE